MGTHWTVYCVDTSSLIRLKVFPVTIFPGVWRNVDQLVAQERLISPDQVLEEIRVQDDEILEWANRHSAVFKRLDGKQLAWVAEILKRFPDLVDWDKERPDADPFVIALALAGKRAEDEKLFRHECAVVAEERRSRNGRAKIPNVCEGYGVRCMDLLGMFEAEGWRFW